MMWPLRLERRDETAQHRRQNGWLSLRGKKFILYRVYK